mmetsp:Transcript_23603/g.41837  ORF Transcript_23603/g.41837 Transcript_23603/m.41837 type:complete len:94 (-) Transcript_23603:834-1115(-)
MGSAGQPKLADDHIQDFVMSYLKLLEHELKESVEKFSVRAYREKRSNFNKYWVLVDIGQECIGVTYSAISPEPYIMIEDIERNAGIHWLLSIY